MKRKMAKNSLDNLIPIHTLENHKEIASRGGKGRKGSKNVKTVLKELLAAKDPNGEWATPVVEKLIQKALIDNDLKALIEIFDRVEGKTPQNLNHGGQENNPIRHEIIDFSKINPEDYKNENPE